MRPIRITLGAAAAVLVLVGAARAQMGGPATVYLEPAEQRAIRKSVELVGTADARRQSLVSAEGAGRVEKMLADAGDFVRAGAPLCRMRTLPVELQLKKAEGQLAAAQATLKKSETGFRREEFDQAEARVKVARAGFERWSLEHQRTRKLLADGASTQAEMDTVEAAYRQAQEQLAEAEAFLALVRTGNRPEDIAAARAQAATASAEVEALKDALAQMTVTAPFDGFVVRKMTEEGQWLSPGAPVAEVVDLAVVRVQMDVPERYLAGLVKGARAPVVFEALGDREFQGEVSQIVPASAEGTHTITVRVDIPNTVENGRPVIAAGLLARVWLPVGVEHEALLVPKSAIIRQSGQDLVYTVTDTKPAGVVKAEAEALEKARKAGVDATRPPPPPLVPTAAVRYAVAIPVRLVDGYGRYMEVQSDRLKAAAPVVTRGTYLLAPDTPVQVYPKEAAGEAPAAKPGAGAAK